MPWNLIESVQRNSNAASQTTIPITGFADAIMPGDLLLLAWCQNVVGAASACSDNSTQPGVANAYTRRAEVTGTTLAGSLIWCVVTAPILPTDTITITVTSCSRSSARLVTFRNGWGPTSILDKSNGNSNTATSPLTLGTSGTLLETNELAFGVGFWKGAGVLSGVADSAGFTLISSAGQGDATINVETNVSYSFRATTTTVTDTHTYTSITQAVGELNTFTLGKQGGVDFPKFGGTVVT